MAYRYLRLFGSDSRRVRNTVRLWYVPQLAGKNRPNASAHPCTSDDHGQFCWPCGRVVLPLMAVVVTLSKGYDLEYMWRQADLGR